MPHVFVDGLRAPATVLELSHWPGNRTPRALKGDVSTQAVLRLLGCHAAERDRLLGAATAVTCDHYDVDGLLSVFCLVRPTAATKHRHLLDRVARCGDFDVFTGAAAVQACLALLSAEREVANRLKPTSVEGATEALFREMLECAEECLLAPGAWAAAWEAEWEHIARSAAYLAETPDALTTRGDLAILHDAPEALHDYAVHARTAAGHVLRVRPDGCHSLRFRYESFVDMQTRAPRPRVHGDVLADCLNAAERNGTWFCESPATATPLLQLYTDSGVPSASSFDPAEIERQVSEFFGEAKANPSLQWRPHSGWLNEAPGTPPSKATA